MSENAFTDPDSYRIVLSEDEWVEVKKELNAGEDRKQSSLALVPMVVEQMKLDGTIERKLEDRIDWSQYEILRLHLWANRWHLHDKQGHVPDLTLEAIRALKVDKFNAINDALFAHILAMAAEKKKERMTQISPSPTAPSAEVVSMS